MKRLAALFAALAAVSLLLVLPGCATLQEMAAVRSLAFAFTGVSDVRLAGIAIGPGTSFATIGVGDAARLGAAVATRQVPIELVAHVGATNPAENHVPARLAHLDWTLFVDQKQALAGAVADPVMVQPGRTADVPIAVRFDLLQFANGGARDLFDLALAISGHGATKKDVRLELVPTVDTSLGPIRYPQPIVVHRAAN